MGRGRRCDGAALAALAAGVVGFFWPVLVTGTASIPFDLQGWHFPQQAFAARALRDGVWPLWNPFVYGGMPFHGNAQAALYYPVNLATLLASNLAWTDLPYRVLESALAFHYWLFGAGVFALARELGTSRAGALAAATAGTFGPFLASQAEHYNLILGTSWMPFGFMLARRLVRRPEASVAVTLAAVLALHLTTGFVPLILSFAVGLSAYALVALAGAVPRRAAVVHLGAAAGLALGLAAVQLLPLVDMARGSMVSERAWVGAVPLRHLWTTLIPDFYALSDRALYRGGDFTQEHFYWPPAAFGLAAAAFVDGGRRRAVGLLAGGVAALGLACETVRWITPALDWLPDLLRSGVEFYTFRALADLAVALLVGTGYDAVLARRHAAGRAALAGVLVVGAAAALASLAPERLLAGAPTTDARWDAWAVAITVSARRTAGWAAITIAAMTLAARAPRKPAAVVLLAALAIPLFTNGAGARFNRSPVPPTEQLGPTHLDGGKTDAVAFLQSRRVERNPWRFDHPGVIGGIWATGAQFWRLESGNGYDPLLPGDTAAYRRAMGTAPDRGRPFRHVDLDSPLYPLLGVRYVVASAADGPGEGIRALDADADPTRWTLVHDGFFRIYEHAAPLPRAFVVRSVETVPDRNDMLARLRAGTVSPRETALVERPLVLPPVPADAAPATAAYRRRSPNGARIAVSGGGGLLVVLDPYHPGWSCWIDGVPAAIERVDFLFRGVVLPPGDHVVRMRFRPAASVAGVAVTLATLVVALAWGRSRASAAR